MKVNFYATLRQIVGRKTIEIPIEEGTTIRELVEVIVDEFPKLHTELLDESGDLYGHLHLFINGRDAPYLDNALDTVVKSDDKVDIFPPVGGGSHGAY